MSPTNQKDQRVDAYILNAQPFAQPILQHLRRLVLKANPHIVETIKWSFVCFEYKGIICFLAAFKEHVSFGFWKASLLNDPESFLQDSKAKGGEAMGNFGRITSLKDLPKESILLDFIHQAIDLNEKKIKVTPKIKKVETDVEVPEIMHQALKKNKKAAAFFQSLSPSQQKDYTSWIEDAKTVSTKEKRLATAIEWLSAEKKRHWKYEKK